ncbi:MAG: hypothetical protein AMXMBFR48_17300 [Ignavibacteriales bacterium]
MNILHLHTELKYSCGITRYLLTVCRSEQMQHRYIVMVRAGEADQVLRNESINITFLSRTPGLFAVFSDLIRLVKVIRKYQIQIIHSHHRYGDFLANLLRPFAGVRTITTVHSIVRGKRWLSYRSENILAVSNSVKQHLLSYFSIEEGKVIVLKNGIDPELYNIREVKSRPDKIFTLGFIGRLSYEKGIDILLQALRGLINERFEFKIVIAGSGEQESNVAEFQTEHPAYCEFIGSVRDISPVYSEIDLFLLPSRIDPFPYVLLECGLFKLPVIAAAVDGITELIDDGFTGRLIQPESVTALKDEVVLAANSKQVIKTWGENLHAKVLSGYTAGLHIAALDEIYSRAVREDD